MLRTDIRPVRRVRLAGAAGSRQHEHTPRRGRIWLLLALGAMLLVTGVVVGHGLLLAAGLVLVGVAGRSFDGPPRRDAEDRLLP